MLLAELAHQIRMLEIRTDHLVEEITGGAYRSVFKGRGIEFDEGLFWRMHSGAPAAALLPPVLEASDAPTGIFGWLDSTLTARIFPVIKAMGRDPVKDYLILGNFDTHAKEYGFDTFDLRVNELAKIGVDMLTGEIEERKIMLPPRLIEYTKNK